MEMEEALMQLHPCRNCGVRRSFSKTQERCVQYHLEHHRPGHEMSVGFNKTCHLTVLTHSKIHNEYNLTLIVVSGKMHKLITTPAAPSDSTVLI